MSRKIHVRFLLAAVAGTSMASATANAALVTEYFNNYGTADTAINPLAGGSGWSAAWSGSTGTTPTSSPYYTPSANLSYSGSGYSNTGNETDTNDGGVIDGSGGRNVFAARNFSSLNGTIWVSFLAAGISGGSNNNPTFQLRSAVSSSSDRNSLRIMGTALRWYNDAGIVTDVSTTINSNTHLLLGRVTINASATDTVEWWVDPNLSSLGSPVVSVSTDLGAGVTGIGLSAQGNGVKWDAIRISNDANGFQQVTQVIPEPTGLMALSAGAMCLLPRRRTSRGEQR